MGACVRFSKQKILEITARGGGGQIKNDYETQGVSTLCVLDLSNFRFWRLDGGLSVATKGLWAQMHHPVRREPGGTSMEKSVKHPFDVEVERVVKIEIEI
jgi:hypothetical protein